MTDKPSRRRGQRQDTPNPPPQARASGSQQDMDDEAIALSALRQVAQDMEAPAAARAQAARTLLELRGQLGRHAAPPPAEDAALSTMSAAELRAELARLRVSRRPAAAAEDS